MLHNLFFMEKPKGVFKHIHISDFIQKNLIKMVNEFIYKI